MPRGHWIQISNWQGRKEEGRKVIGNSQSRGWFVFFSLAGMTPQTCSWYLLAAVNTKGSTWYVCIVVFWVAHNRYMIGNLQAEEKDRLHAEAINAIQVPVPFPCEWIWLLELDKISRNPETMLCDSTCENLRKSCIIWSGFGHSD